MAAPKPAGNLPCTGNPAPDDRRTKGQSLTPPAQTLVVGDVHGCFDELMALIALARRSERDHVVGVGDLRDRGPKSREVVEYFAAEPPRRLCVRGNHENKHLLGRSGHRQSRAGRIVQKQNSPAQSRAMLDRRAAI